MKKSLIALAVAGVVAAPAAFAATSNVDVYGKLHVSIGFYDDQVNSAEDIQISSNASRIGFKGSEDLGGGLKAIWQIESTVRTWSSPPGRRGHAVLRPGVARLRLMPLASEQGSRDIAFREPGGGGRPQPHHRA